MQSYRALFILDNYKIVATLIALLSEVFLCIFSIDFESDKFEIELFSSAV